MNNKVIGIIIGAVAVVIAIFIIVGMVAPQNSTTSSEHKVTYDANGGTVNGQAQFVKNESTFDGTITATWSGRDFGGWYSDKECTTKIINGSKVESDITVYAGWTLNYRLTSGSVSPGGADVFSLVTKTGNVLLSNTMNYQLPDSRTTRIVSNSGTASEFTVVKDVSNIECLKYKVGDRYYYAKASFTGITGTVKVGVENSGTSGYFEFSYNSNVVLDFAESYYGVGYNANGGCFDGNPMKTGIYVYSYTCQSATDVNLTVPGGKVFNGWYTAETGGTKVEVGTNIPFDTSKSSVLLYAQYVDA